MTQTLLSITDAEVRYGGVTALNGVSFSIAEGEVVALMGPNGAGKSTVLKALFGLTPLDRGKVFWHGSAISPLPKEMVLRGVSFVPQGRRVFPHLTVYENLEIGGYTVRDRRQLRDRIAEVLSLFTLLKPKLHAFSSTLSGGQQQMLAIARGLMTEPRVLLLDEPSLGLAPKIVQEVFTLIRTINAERKTAIVVVEHNIKSLLQIANRVYVLEKGSVVAEGSAEKMRGTELLQKVFLGAEV